MTLSASQQGPETVSLPSPGQRAVRGTREALDGVPATKLSKVITRSLEMSPQFLDLTLQTAPLQAETSASSLEAQPLPCPSGTGSGEMTQTQIDEEQGNATSEL